MAVLKNNIARAVAVFKSLKETLSKYDVAYPMEDISDKTTDMEQYVEGIDRACSSEYLKGLTNGNETGWNSGHTQGIKEGRQAQYDEFWDEFQQNGKRTDYRFAFGCGWNTKTFKPKHPIIPKDAYKNQNAASQMFSYIGQSENKYLDLSEYPLDLTKVTQADETFQNAFLENIYVDVTDIRTNKLFNGSDMDRGSHPYKNVTIKCSANTTFSNPFFYANFDKLLFTEDSIIAQSGIDLKWAKGLKSSKESFVNIINTLSATTTGLTVTFNKTAVNTAFGINVDDETTYTDEWKELTASKPNWNIAFADV